MAGPTAAGELKAWELLASLKPADIVRTARVSYDAASACYTIRSLGIDHDISLKDRTVTCRAPANWSLFDLQEDFFRFSVLWYLVNAKDMNATGRLVKLQDIRGGGIFVKGSHVLPLEQVAQTYRNDKAGFLERGRAWGGEVLTLADASLRLTPLPRIPFTLTFWTADEEFPARADLLLDSTAELQAPTDILWSLAMMSVLVML